MRREKMEIRTKMECLRLEEARLRRKSTLIRDAVLTLLGGVCLMALLAMAALLLEG